ncbi:FAD-dependent oxidoreductase [Kineosporia succinea]|uniref:2-polyprenyl-6-methoxyphenol hydroxylase-like FAD-dependent oxidoreductase n=1 Tax=Kineosporia succinea TaxID=84632 RepID=A0ABT9PAM3_9ACTN|nr:FAD-dependent oxidoreductase [Kineosporia succinea]MDP9829737.1 2-polyprenyl-6-methoxyphenol hydroxylase-like FAD-dependent oxidoreductase [Kineosporia succinea]
MHAPANEVPVDVLVVGGGPVGMTVAGDLAAYGRSVTVLEKWPRINPSSRAFATMARTLEILDSRGRADDLLATGSTATRVSLFRRARLDLGHLRSHYPYVLVTPQTNVDQALGRYALEAGADIRRGVEAVGLTQDANGVRVTARPKGDPDPARQQTFRARYVVACDGAHSTVRSLLDLPFPGRAVLSSVVLADVRLTDSPVREGLLLSNTPHVFGFLAAYGREDAGGQWFRSMTWDRGHQVEDSVPVGDDEIVAVLNQAMGRDVGVAEIGWHSRFHSEERQVPRYRVGRVLLAGDAAHIHSPVGGQGMNTGIQDAANLSWKLDAVLGGADDAVLDTYHAERHPIGRRALRRSGLLMRAVTLRSAPARVLRDRIAPLLLSFPRTRDRIAGSLAGTELRYRRPRGAHPLVGTRATEVPLAEGRLTEVQRRPGWVLVTGQNDPQARTGPDGIRRVHRTDAGPCLLVRPDGYIAWAGPEGDGTWVSTWERWAGPARIERIR